MSATKIEVGKVYKFGDSEVYIIYVKEKEVVAREDGRSPMVYNEQILGVHLSKNWDVASVNLVRSQLGEEVQKSYNKADWGVKVLYSILYNECKFMYNQSRKRGFCKPATKVHIEKLFQVVQEKCYNKTRSLANYKKLLERKNRLCRLVVKRKSNSRGAIQRSKRFDVPTPIKLPTCEECPKGNPDEIGESDSAFHRLRYSRTARNHMNLLYPEFTNMGLLKNQEEFKADFPYQINKISKYNGNYDLYMEWLGLINVASYDIKQYKGQEYFPNAKATDGENYIKPYGWPEIYKGRIQTEEEAKALRGCKNKKGLTYPQWLAISPNWVSSVCGHFPGNGTAEEMLNCKKCAIKRYPAWLKGK